MLSSIWTRLFQRNRRAASVSGRRNGRCHLKLEALEDRLALATLFWVGNVNDNWSANTGGINTNWSPDQIPNTGDTLIFTDGAAVNFTSVNDMPGLSVTELRFLQNTPFHLIGIPGFPLTLTGPINVFDQGSHQLDIDIALSAGSHTIDIPAGAKVELGRGVIGTGGITKSGAGTLEYSGTIANTYSGFTFVADGTLELNKDFSVVPNAAFAGNLAAGDGTGAVGSAIVKLMLNSQIPNTSATGTNPDGVIDVNNKLEIVGSVSMGGGSVTIGTGTLTVNGQLSMVNGAAVSSTGAGKLVMGGDFDSFNSTSMCTITGTLDLGSGTRTFDIFDSPTGDDVVIDAAVIGTGGLIKTGAGRMVSLGSTANTYTGVTGVHDGVLMLNKGAGVSAINDLVVVGNDVGSPGSAQLLLGANNQIADNASVSVNFDGQFSLANFNEAIAGLNATAGGVSLGTGVCTVTSLHMDVGSISGTAPGKLVLNGDVTLLSNLGGTATIGAMIDLGLATHTFDLENGPQLDDLVITGSIIGSGGITKTGSGRLRFAMVGNSYTGLTHVGDGELALQTTGPDNQAIVGALTVGDNSGGAASAVVSLLRDHAISDSASVIVNADGRINGNDNDEYIGPLTVNGGSVVMGAADLGLNGALTMTGGSISANGNGGVRLFANVITNAAAGSATLTGKVELAGGTRTFTVAEGAASNDLVIDGLIHGSGGLTKAGTGTMLMDDPSTSITNSYTGVTTVNAGALLLSGYFFNGAIPGNLVVGDGSGAANSAVVRLLLNTEIADAAAVTVNSDGLLDLNSQGEVIGPLTVTGGNVMLGSTQLDVSGLLTMTGGNITGPGMLRLGGDVTTNATATSATITAAVNLGGATRTFTIADGTPNYDLVIDGVISNGGFTKDGAGTVRFNGSSANTYTATTTLKAGHVALNKSAGVAAIAGPLVLGDNLGAQSVLQTENDEQILDGVPVTINSDGALQLFLGSETIGNLTMHFGVLSIFAGEVLTVTNSFTADVSVASPQLIGGGNLAVGGSALSVSFGVPPAVGAATKVIDNLGTGAVTGTFNNLPEGEVFTLGGRTFQITYTGGTGNDVVITRVNTSIIVAAADKGGEPRVHVYDSLTGNEKFPSFLAFGPTYKGGVRVTAGDVTGDGFPDVICAPGTGGNATNGATGVRVFDGVTGQPLAGVLGSGFNPLTLATGKPFTKGFWVASADFNNDGKADVIVAPGSGLSPIVKVISGADGATELASLSALFPETGTYKKGVRVASGDVTGDGRPDLIAQAGTGSFAQLRVIDGVTFQPMPGTLGAGLNPFADLTTVKSPLFIAAGDVDGDGKADIIASAGKGTPLVRILDENSTKIHEFPGNNNPAYKGGMRVAVTDADEDGKADVIIGTGKAKGLQPQVRVVDPESLTELDSFFAFDPGFKGGMWVAGA